MISRIAPNVRTRFRAFTAEQVEWCCTHVCLKPKRIYFVGWTIRQTDVKMIVPFSNSYRVRFNIPSDHRIIVPVVIVIQPRLGIVVLPREAEVIRYLTNVFTMTPLVSVFAMFLIIAVIFNLIPKRIELDIPYDFFVPVRYHLRRAEVIVVIVEGFIFVFLLPYHRKGFAVEINVIRDQLPFGRGFFD